MNKLYRMMWKIEDGIREVKYAYQRVVRGYDDTLLWDMADYLNKIILPALKDFKKNKHGFPNKMKGKEWNKELDLMIKGFEASAKQKNWGKSPSMNQWYKLETTRLNGMKEFILHYNDLWD